MIKILSSIFLTIVFFAVITLLYAVFIKDEENFTHIIAGFFSALIFIVLGYVSYVGIEFRHVVENATIIEGVVTSITETVKFTTYQYGWLAGGLILVGVIVALYTVVEAIRVNSDMISELEDDNIYDGSKGSM